MSTELYQSFEQFRKKHYPNNESLAIDIYFDTLLLVVCRNLLICDSFEADLFSYSKLDNVLSYIPNTLELTPDDIGVAYEKAVNRRKTGTYFTPRIVTDFIAKKALDQYHAKESNSQPKVLDPSCGSGEFLLSAFEYLLLNNTDEKNDIQERIIKLSDQIYGVDISRTAIEIARFRLIYCALSNGLSLKNVPKLKFHLYVGNSVLGNGYGGRRSLKRIFEEQPKVFNYEEWLSECNPFNWRRVATRFDIVVGNPPYIELSKVKSYKPTLSSSQTGNIFASFVERSLDLLSDGGVVGMILPISFLTTKRMKPIRDLVLAKSSIVEIYSYADRPGSLFTGVHQKLNILFCKKGDPSGTATIRTSSYIHFYSDRITLDTLDPGTITNELVFDDGIPKLGNDIEKSIFNKVYNWETQQTFNYGGKHHLYINSRSCFWMKTFFDQPHSSDYLDLKFDNQNRARHVYAVFNSSLFFWFWEVISDGWHLRKADLNKFNFKSKEPNAELIKLSSIVENKLETTKMYIGSKQVDYEYKHKLVKKELDQIDKVLAKIYDLTDEELKYIIKYQVKYRMNDEYGNYIKTSDLYET